MRYRSGSSCAVGFCLIALLVCTQQEAAVAFSDEAAEPKPAEAGTPAKNPTPAKKPKPVAKSKRQGGRFFIDSAQSKLSFHSTYPDFRAPKGLKLVGTAATEGDRLRLASTTSNSSGAAWMESRFPVAGGFKTSFDFELSGGTSDGFAFLVQNTGNDVLFGSGARLGYGAFGSEGGGIANSVAVQFDTFQNAENNDPSGNYVSVHTRGTLPNSTHHMNALGQASVPAPLAGGGIHHVEITYKPGKLSIYFDRATEPLLVVPLDLSKVLSLEDGRAYLGFTAGTGTDFQNHELLNWRIDSTP